MMNTTYEISILAYLKITGLKFLVNFHFILVQFMIVFEIGKTLDNSVEVLSK